MVLKSFLALGLIYIKSALMKTARQAANLIWIDLWELIFSAIAEAEKQFQQDSGKLRKEWVMDQVVHFLGERAKLNFIQNFLVQVVISRTIDAIIAQINAEFGHDWVAKAKEVERQLADKLPIID